MKGLLNIKVMLFRLLTMVGLYSLIRFLFYLYNLSLFQGISIDETITIFFQGIRFDITIIIYINLMFIIMSSLPFPIHTNKKYAIIQKGVYLIFNLAGIFIALADIAFYRFNSKRLDSEALSLLGTLPKMLGSFLADYWYLILLFIVIGYALSKVYNFVGKRESNVQVSFIKRIISFVLVLSFGLIGIRGGFQNRPLSPAMANSIVRMELAPLITNSPLTFFFSLANRKLDSKNYYSDVEVNNIYPIKKRIPLLSDSLRKRKPNIVILILESFSAEYMGFLTPSSNYTPVMDSLSKKSLVFNRAFANGRRSSQGLVAITGGIPALMDDPIMYSEYMGNNLYALPFLLNRFGYQTAFLNSSPKKMLGWQNYIGKAGFEQYLNKDDYNKPENDDGHWGTYDHYFLGYLNKKLGEFNQPFFATFFTISSHDPYLIPEYLQSKFGKSGNYFNALRYADWSLGEFFKEASKQPWFDNTIFILTADHTNGAAWKSPDQNQKNFKRANNRVGIYHIPIMIYAPQLIAASETDRVIQQMDIFNTVLSLVDYEDSIYSFGQSVFSEEPGFAVQYVNGIYQLIEGDYILLFQNDIVIGLYNYIQDIDMENNLINDEKNRLEYMQRKLKAIIQQYNNTLNRNSMKL